MVEDKIYKTLTQLKLAMLELRRKQIRQEQEIKDIQRLFDVMEVELRRIK